MAIAQPADQANKAIANVHQLFASLQDQSAGEAASRRPFPAAARVADIYFPEATDQSLGDTIHVLLDFPEDYMASPEFTDYQVSRFGFSLIATLETEGIQNYILLGRDPVTGDYVDIQDLLPADPPPTFKAEIDQATVEMARALGKPETRTLGPVATRNMPVINPGQPQGALSGKTIYINQSHGWFDDVDFGRWRVQRGNCFGIVEDFASAEFINVYVLPMLRNAGAKVQTVREMDLQTNMVIVDNADGTANPANGTYVETGTWATSSINGFKQKTTAAWTGVTVNPFNQGAGQNRLSSGLTTGAPTATATWTATIPADGYYNVYASWTAFSGRAQDAQYLVHHSGGVSEIRVDQTLDGYTWNLLGNWYFEKNAPADQRKVVLTNVSADTDAVNVSADAVRWGGGMGDMARQTHGVSGRPRWEEDAVNYLQFTGFGYSGTLYGGTDDEAGGWSDRPQYARWEHSEKDGSREDAIYFAWHTNALSGCTTDPVNGSAARGLATYTSDSSSAASITLRNTMHDEMYRHIAGQWFPGWTVRGKNTGNFGENNQGNLGSGLPGFLIEGLFHDNAIDTTNYGEPKFRHDYARAIVHAVIKYFEGRDGINLTTPPETPVEFRALSIGGNKVRLSWAAPVSSASNSYRGDPATSYRIYTSRNGFGFDDGVAVPGTTIDMDLPGDGTPRFYRVASVNAGGQSFPSEVLAASKGSTKVLVVNGFDRNQRSLVPMVVVPNAGSGALVRVDPRNFQAFNYVIEHAKALAPHGVSISSTSNEALVAGRVSAADYDVLVWILGEESTVDETFSAAERTLVQNFLSVPGRGLFVSGSEIGWDLDNKGDATDKAFISTTLGSTYVGDDAQTYNILASAGGPFAGMAAFNLLPAQGARYDADSPDQLGASTGAAVSLTYSGGGAGNAAIHKDGTSRVISLGFPFETISGAAVREDLMGRALEYLLPAPGTGDAWILTGE